MVELKEKPELLNSGSGFTYSKAGDRIRTDDVQLGKPTAYFVNDGKLSTSESSNSNTSAIPSNSLHSKGFDDELQAVINAWPGLPEAAKKYILAIIREEADASERITDHRNDCETIQRDSGRVEDVEKC